MCHYIIIALNCLVYTSHLVAMGPPILTYPLQDVPFEAYYRLYYRYNVKRKDVAKGILKLNQQRLLDLDGIEKVSSINKIAVLIVTNNPLKSLPDPIGELTQLRELALMDNRISAIPDSIGNLKGLLYLYLSRNKLASLPKSISQLSRLRILYLNGNQLTTIPELDKLTELKELVLADNKLVSLPASIGVLKSLGSLDCSHNLLTILPDSSYFLAELKSLDLSHNQLTALPITIGNLLKLEILNVDNNNLVDMPVTVHQLALLKRLCAANNKLANFPGAVANLTKLELLDVSNNPIRYSIKQLHDRLHLAPKVKLVFKTKSEEKRELQLFDAVAKADNHSIMKLLKSNKRLRMYGRYIVSVLNSLQRGNLIYSVIQFIDPSMQLQPQNSQNVNELETQAKLVVARHNDHPLTGLLKAFIADSDKANDEKQASTPVESSVCAIASSALSPLSRQQPLSVTLTEEFEEDMNEKEVELLMLHRLGITYRNYNQDLIIKAFNNQVKTYQTRLAADEKPQAQEQYNLLVEAKNYLLTGIAGEQI